MKTYEFKMRIMKHMKTLEFHVRITKGMKIVDITREQTNNI